MISVALGPYIVEVKDGPKLFQVDPIRDTVGNEVSGHFGDGTGIDLCGPRDYELFEEVNFQLIIPTFARLSPTSAPSLIIEPNGPEEIGEHDMVL